MFVVIIVESMLLLFRRLLIHLPDRRIQLQTLNPLAQVKTIQVIERHQMSIPTKDIHEVISNTNRLPIPRTRLLPNNLPIRLVIDDLLLLLLLG